MYKLGLFYLLSLLILPLSLAQSETILNSSSQTEISFQTVFNTTAQNSASQESALKSDLNANILLPLNDDQFIKAQVVCFVVPSGANPVLSNIESELGAKITDITISPSYDKNSQIRIIPPVSIRGMKIGKVLIPEVIEKNGNLYKRASANIQITFRGGDHNNPVIENSHFIKMLSSQVLNLKQARSWSPAKRSGNTAEIYNPFAQSGNWVRISTRFDGVFKINRADLSLAGVDLSNLDPRTFRLFNAGGKRLQVINDDMNDSLSELAVKVFGEEDGIFSGDDFIMFYGFGPDFWDWSSEKEFHQHPYSDRNVYYLTWGGGFESDPLRISTINGTTGVVTTPAITQFTDWLHFEDNNYLNLDGNEIWDYFTWYWSTDPQLSIFENLPTPLSDVDQIFRIKAFASKVVTAVNGTPAVFDSTVNDFYYFTSDNFSSSLNQIILSLTPNFRGNTLTDFVEFQYQRPLDLAGDDELLFYADENLTGISEYKIANASSTRYLLDITDFRNQKIIEGVVAGSEYLFNSEPQEKSGRVFIMIKTDGLRQPFSISATEIEDLRSVSNSGEFLLITHDNFYNQALEFASYRTQQDNISTKVVKVSDVYAQFSGGRLDPVAIRNFLAFAYHNWQGDKPAYCLLIGDGINDFRGTQGINYIPPFIVDTDSTVSDENFAYLDQLFDLDSDNSLDTIADPIDRGVDLVIGRWPIKNNAEFDVVANKMIKYDTGSSYEKWRNLLTLISDDENHPNSAPEIFHTRNSENLADRFIPLKFDLNKIYGVDYPYGTKGEKPLMRDAIIRSINNGTLLVNYIGHGNPNVWADERIFRRTQDISQLNNNDRLPLIFNASCSIGFFDDPIGEGMAEDLLRFPNGGSIGTISATRVVFSLPNASFNQDAMEILLGDKNNYTIAEALYVTKLLRQGTSSSTTNDRKYIYIGDPLTKLGLAPLSINFETFEPDSFVALTVTELGGSIVDGSNQLVTDFNGTVTLSIFDNERTRTFRYGPFTVITYKEYSSEIYRGKVDVLNGHFDLKFVVPKDISYGGKKARISAYAADGKTGAAGFIAPIAIGSINSNVNDTTGPEIKAYFNNDPLLNNGSVVKQNEKLTIELFDSLGINLTGEIGHAIELVLNDQQQFAHSLTDSFVYNSGSYQEGLAQFTLPELPLGRNSLKIKAWDSANNSNQIEIDFNVETVTGIEINDLLCYPNPVKEDCRFTYSLSGNAEEVVLKIFTLSGLEIYNRSALPSGAGYHGDIYWDGRDLDGDKLANGVYLFQLSATGNSHVTDYKGDNKAIATSKLIIMK